MTYYNPVLAMGEDAFLARAREAGRPGVIVPDLPVDEGGRDGASDPWPPAWRRCSWPHRGRTRAG